MLFSWFPRVSLNDSREERNRLLSFKLGDGFLAMFIVTAASEPALSAAIDTNVEVVKALMAARKERRRIQRKKGKKDEEEEIRSRLQDADPQDAGPSPRRGERKGYYHERREGEKEVNVNKGIDYIICLVLLLS
jgi:hypothetical protein